MFFQKDLYNKKVYLAYSLKKIESGEKRKAEETLDYAETDLYISNQSELWYFEKLLRQISQAEELKQFLERGQTRADNVILCGLSVNGGALETICSEIFGRLNICIDFGMLI